MSRTGTVGCVGYGEVWHGKSGSGGHGPFGFVRVRLVRFGKAVVFRCVLVRSVRHGGSW